MAVIYQCLQ